MKPAYELAQWWSSSTTWRLLRCPSSAVPSYEPAKPPAKGPGNAGSIAHLALQQWIENGEWRHEDPGIRLQGGFDEIAAARGIDLARMPQALITRARLKSRGRELSVILAGAESGIRTELLLTDEANRLFGILDVTAGGAEGLIIDLKTGRDASVESPAVKHQMTFYAHLFQVAYGVPPKHVIVFNLRQGPAEVKVAPSTITDLLDQIRTAQLMKRTLARPEADVCRYCMKRMTCEPHWKAVTAWDPPDAIEGTVSRIERSSSGVTALRIGGQWLTGITDSQLPDDVMPGRFVRAVRIRRRNDGTTPEEWAASSITEIRSLPSS
ncbi:hypothetical protein GCM10009784_07930 [Arthrobacter parietis]|uniref:PD-(D/E)XK endonuclease-like domain-containing protein n=1 Tax=Arthrobacter parietis TaxID=271434 RepID=A0ABP5MFX9_9MICC